MNAIAALMMAVMLPLMFLNMLGGIISGIWLLILREWGVLGLGIVAFLGSTFLLGLALAPGVLLAAPAMYLAEKGHRVALYPFMLLSSLYTVGVLTAWCGLVLFVFVSRATPDSIIPTLLWSYGVAVGPITFMASKEDKDSHGTTAATFGAQVGYVAMMVMVLFSRVTIFDVLSVFVGIMAVSVAVQFAIAIAIHREAATTEPRTANYLG